MIDIHDIKLVTSNNCDDYAYVECSIELSIKHKSKEFRSVFQTGHSYKMNDYSLPSNSLSVYSGSDCLLEDLDKLYESDIDAEKAQELNEKFNLEFTDDDYVAIYTEINHQKSDADLLVSEAELNFMNELEQDSRVFVEQQYVENERQFSRPDFKSFNDQSEAEEYVENNKNSFIISKEEFYVSQN